MINNFYPNLMKNFRNFNNTKKTILKNLKEENSDTDLLNVSIDQLQEYFNKIFNELTGLKYNLNFNEEISIEKIDKKISISKKIDKNDKESLYLQKCKIEHVFKQIIRSFKELGFNVEKIDQTSVRGIINAGNDCFYISLLQMLSNPEFDPIFRIGEKEKGTFIEMIQKIRNEVNSGKPFPLQPLAREFRNVLNLPANSQEDITEVFVKLIDVIRAASPEKKEMIDQLLEIQDSQQSILKEFGNTPFYKTDGFAYSPDEALTFGLNQESAFVRNQNVNSSHCIMVDNINKHKSFVNWLRSQFTVHKENCSLPVYLPEIDSDTKLVRKATLIENKKDFTKFPPILAISPVRRDWDSVKRCGVTLTDRFDMPQEFEIKDHRGIIKTYELSSFSVQVSHNEYSNGGHYYTYRKRGNAWYKVNDNISKKIEDANGFTPKEIIDERNRGYFYIYKEKNFS